MQNPYFHFRFPACFTLFFRNHPFSKIKTSVLYPKIKNQKSKKSKFPSRINHPRILRSEEFEV